MPSTKKRINLTIPDNVYDRLEAYKAQNGIANDATACLQLIVQQLNAQDRSAAMLELVRRLSPEDMKQLSSEGLTQLKIFADKSQKD